LPGNEAYKQLILRSTFVGVFTIKNSWCLYGEDTEKM